MKRHLPLSVSETALVNESLRIMELSLLWYGTREHSWERLAQFVTAEAKDIICKSVAMLRARLEGGSLEGVSCFRVGWLGTVNRIVFQLTGFALGKAWVPEPTAQEILDVFNRILNLNWHGPSPTDQELAALKQQVSQLHAQMSGILPAGRPWSQIRFFGWESYGKVAVATREASTEPVKQEAYQ